MKAKSATGLVYAWALAALLCPFAVVVADDTAKPADSAKDKATQEPAANPRLDRSSAPKTVAEDRSSRSTARARGDLTFDDIKFDIEKGGRFERSMLPKEIEELNKKTIRIRGYILPASVFKQSGIEEFVLVRDNMECCFGPGAALYDCIMIRMEKGKTAEFTTKPVAVKGKFEIEEFKFPMELTMRSTK